MHAQKRPARKSSQTNIKCPYMVVLGVRRHPSPPDAPTEGPLTKISRHRGGFFVANLLPAGAPRMRRRFSSSLWGILGTRTLWSQAEKNFLLSQRTRENYVMECVGMRKVERNMARIRHQRNSIASWKMRSRLYRKAHFKWRGLRSQDPLVALVST